MDKFRRGYRMPPLTKQLKNILDQYPDDGQILKELIQNAEDARATEIIFLLDDSNYGTDPKQLIHPDLAQFQGPALYAYNNAEFSENDWESIAMLLHSKKEDDPMTVGRYGMGFKSVYHMTDLPSLASGDAIAFMDPHERYFKDPEHGERSCSLWKFSEDCKQMKTLDHQFRPFYEHAHLFGLSGKTLKGGLFTGKTLFRFPLRSSEAKQRSELSNNIYTPEKVRNMLNDLEKDGGNVLLFLMHLQHIKVYENVSGHKNIPVKTLEISLSESCLKVVTDQRLKFDKFLNVLKTEEMTDTSLSVSFPIKFEVKSSFNAKKCRSSQHAFMVTHFYSGKVLAKEEVKRAKDSLRVLPWVGAAIPLDSTTNSSEIQGQIYNFLPLPLETRSPTGLSTHVHGYFVLDQNRRHLKWPDAGSSTVSDRHHIWNIFLMKELVPQALAQMAEYISSFQTQSPEHLRVVVANFTDKRRTAQFQMNLLNSVMPNLQRINPGWKPLAETFYKEIVRHPVFFSEAKHGTWLSIYDKETIVDNCGETTNLAKLLRKVLIASDKNLVSVPEFVISAIERFNSSSLRRIQPDDICMCLKANSVELSNEEKMCLLPYLLTKLEERGHLGLCQLIGIPLLPLDNGTWVKFEARSVFVSLRPLTTEIYIETLEHRQHLLPGLQSKFIRSSVNDNKVLQSIAKGGSMQLKMLDKNSILQLLRLVPGLTGPHQVPSFGFTVSLQPQQTLVIPNTTANLTPKYFELVWQYIEKHCVTDLRSLANLNLYLVPFNQCKQLALLSENLPLIVWKAGECSHLKTALVHLRASVLDDLSRCVSNMRDIMGKYILRLTLSGLLELLSRLKARCTLGSLVGRFESLSNEQKDAFRHYIGSRLESEQINSSQKELIRSLPIFRTLDQSGGLKEHFVSLEKVGSAVSCSFQLPVRVPSVLIHCTGPGSESLRQCLDIRILNEAEVLSTLVFPLVNNVNSTIYSPAMIEKAAKFSLENLELFERQHTGFIKSVSQLRFLPSAQGQLLKMPCELFDDSFTFLRDFFTSNNFPSGEFSKEIYRKELKKVKLKGPDKIRMDDFLVAGKDIHYNPAKLGKQKKACAMLTLLNSSLKSGTFSKMEKLTLKDQLKSLNWVPCCKDRPKDYPEFLAFIGETCSLLAPQHIYEFKFCHVIGTVKPTVNLHGMEHLAELFECAREPTVQEVIRHLDNIVTLYLSEADTGIRNKRKLRDTTGERQVDKIAAKLCDRIYEFLNERVENNKEYLSTLSEKNYILVNGHFIKPSRCALQSQLNCLPFMCGSLDLSYKSLWQAIGVKTEFDVDSYVQIVKEIYDDIGLQPLSSSQLNMFIKIISECTASAEESCSMADREVYLPDRNGILRLASQMSFNDTPWLPINCEEKVQICHHRIAYPDAQKLGVTSWRQKTVQCHSRKLLGHRFGQKEKLVNRLKRILEGYPINDGILKEMVQNADDAGATKIHFIKDMRNLSSDRIFDDKWKPVQGTSLCVYNNKPFTQKDLQGIQDLGEGSKSHERQKIGQYGVGFNCVYHLTDVPTFITTVENLGRVLCVLDPTLQHIDGATEESPGCMFDDLGTFTTKFPDVFDGYLEKYYDTSGTIFRFPLRKSESAISNNVATEETMDKLFKIMKMEMQSCLLFLNNVREIALKEIRPNGQIVDIFCVQAKLNNEDENKLTSFQNTSKEICSKLEKDGCLERIKAREITYTMETSDSRNGKHQWLIVQQLGFEDPSCVSEELRAAYKSGALNHLPLGGVAYEMNQTQKKANSKLFCFLPLPKPIHLPVHINGHFCLDTETRRNLIEDNKDEIQQEWNTRLMTNVVAQAYCSIIMKTSDSANREIENCKRNSQRRGGMNRSSEDILENYRLVFPDIPDTDGEYIRRMCVAVYQMLWKLNYPILPVYSAPQCMRNGTFNITWLSPQGVGSKKPCFDLLMSEVNHVFKEQSDILSTRKGEPNHREIQLRRMLISCGFPLVHSSCQLYYKFATAGLPVEYSSPDRVLEFFAGFKEATSSCTMSPLPLRLADTPFESVEVFETVLQYCAHSKNFRARLGSAPFLLTADEYLREFDGSSKPYSSSYYDLVPRALHMFAHMKIKGILHDAGMTRDFNAADLIGLLSGILLEEHFFGNDKFVSFQFFKHFLQKQALVKLTPEQLLKGIWDFISRHAVAKDYPHLSSWCLLPVTLVEKSFLLPISKARHGIEKSEVEKVDPKLLSALINVGMPVLDNQYVSSSTIEKLLNESIHLSVSIVNYFIGHTGCLLKVNEERRSLLRYLSHYQDEWKSTEGACHAIRRLPVFEYYDGTIGDLQKLKRYIVPPSIPNDGSSKWAPADDVLFLNHSHELLPFLNLLGCEYIQEDQIYRQFILERFSEFSNADRLTHLTFVRDTLIDQFKNNPKKLENLQKGLHNLKFLSRNNGPELYCASSYFDGRVDIFQIMQDRLDFPPEPYNTDEWLDFLQFCGLVHKVTDDHLLRYAEEIARDTKDANDEDQPVRKKAKIVVENIMKLTNLSDSFAEKLKTMPIVEAAVVPRKMMKLHLQKSYQSRPFISYKDAVEEKHKDLVWTTSDMLPSFATATTTRKRKLEQLEVQTMPLTETVAQHLLNICNSFLKATNKQKAEVKEELLRVTKEIYKFLGSNDVNSTSISLLTTNQCIVLDGGTELARPDQVVIALPEECEIRPYLYRLSFDLCEYLSFFEKLNMSQNLQPEHYTGVLRDIHKKVGHRELTPNERKLVLMAFAGFLRQLRIKNSLSLNQLILPSDNGRLYDSSQLVINDNSEFAERSRKCKSLVYLIDLDDLKDYDISDITYKIFEKVPECLRPSLLSSIATQKLATVSSGKITRSNRLRDTITSQEFNDGLLRLLNLQTDTMNGKMVIEKIKDLSKIQIYEVPKVITYLEHKKKRIPSSEKECRFFITKDGTAEATAIAVVYIDQNLQTDAKESNILNIKLTEIVNELLDGALQSVLLYVPPLFQCDPREIASTLDKLGHHERDSSNKREQSSFLPKLGSHVPINMQHMLQQGFFAFKKGEFAALEYGDVEDSIYIMVEIMEEISEKCPSDSMLNARYKVNTGENGEQIVNGSDLYKFCSPPCFDEAGAIVLVPIQSETNPTASVTAEESLNYNDIIRDIKKSLIEARSLPEDQRRRVIKRLYLRWHPDKNPPHLSKLCTQIVQQLQHLVKRLDTLSLEEEGDNSESTTSQDFPDSNHRQSRHRSRNRTSASSENFNYQNFNFGYFDETAKKHKEQSRANTSSGGSGQQGFFSFGQAFTSRPNPQPQEAKRWMRQAEFDLESAAIDKEQRFYEWSCYKYHQAAEKSLKAIQFKRDANQNFTHNLSSLCSGIDNQQVIEWVAQLDRLIPNPAAMRYPNSQNYPRIPHDVYDENVTDKAKNLAEKIVKFAQNQIT